MLTSILAIYTIYSDKTSCTTDSLTKIVTVPLTLLTCTPNYDGNGYYKDICSNGVLQVVDYTNANCTTISSTNPQPTGCQNGMKRTCSAAPASPTAQQVFQKPVILYKRYTTTDCSGDAYSTNVWFQDVCSSSGTSIESDKLTCINNVPSRNSYADSATCTGTASNSPLPATTCTR